MAQTKSPQDSEFANQAELTDNEAAAADSVSDRKEAQGSEPESMAEDDVRKPIGATPRSEQTGRHDAGSDANETEDGLTQTEETVRKGAEELPTGTADDLEDMPVFDRGDTLPRV